MALSLVANFTATENPPSGFVDAGANGIQASGGIGIAENTASIAASAYNTLLTANQAFRADLSFTTFAEAAVFAKATSAVVLTSDRYFVKVQQTAGNAPDTISIIQRKSTVDTVLVTEPLLRGKIASGDQLGICCFDAGTVTIIQAYYNGILIMEYVDSTNPIQGNGYTGMWIAASSSGMGFDNAYAGNITVKWVCPSGGASNPTQSGGNDSTGSGTFASPWATIKHAAHNTRMTTAGEILVVRGGNYADRLSGAHGDLTWRSGTSENTRTVIQAFPGETVTNTYTGGATQVGFANAGGVNTYITWLNMNGTGGGRLAGSGNGGIHIANGSTYIRIQGGEYQQFSATGAITSTAKTVEGIANYHLELIDVETHHNGATLSDHGMYLKHPGTILEGCNSHHNAWAGLQIQPFPASGDARADNFIVRRSQFHHNGDIVHPSQVTAPGIILAYGDDCLFMSNLCYRNQGSNITITSNSNNGAPPARTLVYNNTLAFSINREGLRIGAGDGPGPDTTVSDTEAKNNILFENFILGITEEARSDGTVLANNLNPTTGSETDPLFVSETDGNEDFHLHPASPCIAAGADLGAAYNLDFDGNTRPGGSPSVWDQGAFQFLQSGDPPVISHSGTYQAVGGSYVAIPASFVDPNSDASLVEVDSAGNASVRVVSIPSGVIVDL